MEQEGEGGEDTNKKEKQKQLVGDAKAAQVAVAVKCPRCDSMNTKFCYYNNYSLSQPRYFCKACKRYWTHGGALRNVPVGGGSRKPKRAKLAANPSSEATVVGVPAPSSVSSVTPFFQGDVGGFLSSSSLGGSGFNNVGSHHFFDQMMMGGADEQQRFMMNENRAHPLINPDGSMWSTLMTTTTHINNNNSSGASSFASSASDAAAALTLNQWPSTVTGFPPLPPSSF
ncbi:uncharacterized protein [Arachis hypogaea]|uniref:uncharacterized protein n=1 Tax=Arachis hypogaea TaxID=3818 RepID=UPI000DEC1680|nr:dof zinc finger protein DOF1.1-like [Arachis hypogaea]